MAHSLLRLTESVYNVPHCITPSSLTVVLDYLENRNNGAELARYDDKPKQPAQAQTYPGGFGVLSVDGSLTYKPVMGACGELNGTSYQSLINQTEAMAAAGVKTIVMEVASGGGQAAHCFETANEIRAICDENGINLIGYADEMAASAAYALISVCDVVIANPSAQVGSIGCVVALLDDSKAMDRAGLKRIFITSGESKVPFDADGSFKKSFLEDIQARVDMLNEDFTSHVSQYTGLDAKTIRSFEAKVFTAQEALKLGLINSVMTNKEFAQYVAQAIKEPNEA
jgi:ClpP class serine protease